MPSFPIQLKRNGTAAATPSSLLHGEVALNYADGKLFWKDASNVIQSFALQAYALSSHTHAASAITSGTLDAARLPLATTIAAGAVIVGTGLGVSSGTVSVTYGTSAGTACQGNDSRLSDARTPTSHSHGNITNAGAIGSTANLPIITTTSGVLTTGSFGTSAATFCEGNDSRLSDTRTPTDNTVSTAKLQDDAVTYAKIQNVSATDRLLGRSSAGSGDVEEITCTSFGRALLDDTSHAAQLTTLGAAPLASPTFTGTVTVPGLTATAAILADDLSTTNSVVYSFDGDPNTGVGRGGADIVTVVTAGSERMRVDASGNVGIKNTPTTVLEVGTLGKTPVATANAACFWGANLATASTGNANLQILSTDNQAADLGGTLGLGGSYNTTQSLSFAVIAGRKTNSTSNNAGGYMQFFTRNQGGGVLVEGMRLNDDAYLLVGYTASNGAYKLQVNSQIYATNATIATSDARFKTNVEALTDATAVIEALRPVAFDFIPHAERNFATERQVGLIAQETQSALAGTDYADSVVAQCGDHLGLAYEKLVPVLIKALQESNARIAALEERTNA